MRKKNEVRYNTGEGVVVLTLLSDTGAKMDQLKANERDKKRIRQISTIFRDKYDIDLTPHTFSETFGKDFFDF